MPVTKETQKEFNEFLIAKKSVVEILSKFTNTQNSFIDEDGTNGFNEMLEELAILVTTFKD